MSIRKTIIATTAIVATVAMVAPSFAGAVTVAELQAQINALLAQLQTLQGGTTTTTGNVPAVCAGVTFTRNLKVGSTGSDVKCLQALLNVTPQSGYFGPKTLAAVRAYQTAQGLTPANQVGPMTRAALNAQLGGTGGGGGGTTPTPGPVVPTGAGLTVALASDNPAASTLVTGSNILTAPSQAGADLAHFTFVNGDNAEVKVTGLKLKRIGVGADATLANVYLYDGAVRLTDAASVSETIMSFNDSVGLFTVPAGGSKTIKVLSDIALSSSGQTLGVQVVDATGVTTNASSVKGTFPVAGNLHTTATATLAAVNWGTATPSSSADVDPQNDYTVWSDTATVTTRAVNFTRFAIRQTGSALPADIQNLRLLVDGVQAGSAVTNVDANGYATWDLSASPVKLETGSRTIKILGDIIGGSSKNFIFSLRNAADAKFVDTQVGVSMIPTGGSAVFTTTNRTTGTMSITSGTITIVKASDSPSGNIVNNAPNATLAKYTVKAAGEPVKIESLDVALVCSAGGTTSGARNGALYANGVQIGSTATLNCTSNTTLAYTQYSLGSSLIVTPGSPVTLEVRADIYMAAGTALADGNTLKARIVADTGNAEGRVSKTTVNVPATAVDGSTVTVKEGALTLSKYTAYTNQTAVPPFTNFKLAHFTLTSATTEAVNINTIQVNLSNVASSYITNLYAKYGDTQLTTKPTISAYQQSWSVNYALAAGKTVDITVYGDAASSTAAGSCTVGLYIAGTTASSAVAVTAGGSTTTDSSQTIAFGTGSITPTFASTPQNQVVIGGQQIWAGRYKFTAANDSYTVTEAKIRVPSTVGTTANSGVITDAVLKVGSDVVGAARPFDTTITNANDGAYFTGMSVAVPANTTKYIDVWYDLSTPSATAGTDQLDVQPTLTYVKALNSQGDVKQTSDSTITIGTAASNHTYIFKTLPTFAKQAINASTASTGSTAELYKFTVTADAKGDVALKQVKFSMLVTNAVAATIPSVNTMKLFRDGTDISTSLSGVTIQNASGTSLESTTTSVSSDDGASTVVVTFNTEETITAGTTHTYSLKGLLNNFLASSSGNDSVATNMLTDSSSNGTLASPLVYPYYTTGTIYQLASQAANGGSDATNFSIIWSDNSATSHSDAITSSGSNDFINGYLLPGVTTDTSTVSAI